MTDHDTVWLRLVDEPEAPIRHRDRHVSVGRGRTAAVSRRHADRLLAERDFFEELCSTRLKDGDDDDVCLRPADACQYHNHTDTDVEEPGDDDDSAT